MQEYKRDLTTYYELLIEAILSAVMIFWAELSYWELKTIQGSVSIDGKSGLLTDAVLNRKVLVMIRLESGAICP